MISKPILLMERDGRERYIHGIALIDENIDADEFLRGVYRKVVDTIGEEWNYDHIFDAIEDHGYHIVKDFGRFYEDQMYDYN